MSDNTGNFCDDVNIQNKESKKQNTSKTISNDFEFPASFPESKQQKEESFGGFFDIVDNKSSQSTNDGKKKNSNADFEFPDSFPEHKKEEQKEEFGSFFDDVDNNELSKDKENKKQNDDFKFPDSFPEEKKEETQESLDGFFYAVDDNNEQPLNENKNQTNSFHFPDSFPEEKKDEKQETFGGFFDDVDDNENQTGESPKKDNSKYSSAFIEHEKNSSFKTNTESVKKEEIPPHKVEEKPKKEEIKTTQPNKVKIGEKITKTEENVSLGIEAFDQKQRKPSEDELYLEEDSDDQYAPADLEPLPEKKGDNKQNDDQFSPSAFGDIKFPDQFPDFNGVAIEGKDADPMNIIELLNDSMWEAPTVNPSTFFSTPNRFDSEEKAFLFLTK